MRDSTSSEDRVYDYHNVFYDPYRACCRQSENILQKMA